MDIVQADRIIISLKGLDVMLAKYGNGDSASDEPTVAEAPVEEAVPASDDVPPETDNEEPAEAEGEEEETNKEESQS